MVQKLLLSYCRFCILKEVSSSFRLSETGAYCLQIKVHKSHFDFGSCFCSMKLCGWLKKALCADKSRSSAAAEIRTFDRPFVTFYTKRTIPKRASWKSPWMLQTSKMHIFTIQGANSSRGNYSDKSQLCFEWRYWLFYHPCASPPKYL